MGVLLSQWSSLQYGNVTARTCLPQSRVWARALNASSGLQPCTQKSYWNRLFLHGSKERIGNLFSITDQKFEVALCQLSFGVSADGLVEMLRLSESLIYESRMCFTVAFAKRFEKEYLWLTTMYYATTILARHAKLGFPKCFGLLDRSTWKLSSCFVDEQQKKAGQKVNFSVQARKLLQQ